MMRLLLRIGLVLAILAGTGSTAGPAPALKCGRQTAGTFWPEEANRDSDVMHRAERCGTLLYCARTTFGWKWQPMTIAAKLVPACEVEKTNPVEKSDTWQSSH